MLQSSQSLLKSYRYKNFGNHGQRHVVLAQPKEMLLIFDFILGLIKRVFVLFLLANFFRYIFLTSNFEN